MQVVVERRVGRKMVASVISTRNSGFEPRRPQRPVKSGRVPGTHLLLASETCSELKTITTKDLAALHEHETLMLAAKPVRVYDTASRGNRPPWDKSSK
jgi:hypothetical protein